jgi:hypothetical protein
VPAQNLCSACKDGDAIVRITCDSFSTGREAELPLNWISVSPLLAVDGQTRFPMARGQTESARTVGALPEASRRRHVPIS